VDAVGDEGKGSANEERESRRPERREGVKPVWGDGHFCRPRGRPPPPLSPPPPPQHHPLPHCHRRLPFPPAPSLHRRLIYAPLKVYAPRPITFNSDCPQLATWARGSRSRSSIASTLSRSDYSTRIQIPFSAHPQGGNNLSIPWRT
jgi:hypothetical protein